jgi:hypothetical protein
LGWGISRERETLCVYECLHSFNLRSNWAVLQVCFGVTSRRACRACSVCVYKYVCASCGYCFCCWCLHWGPGYAVNLRLLRSFRLVGCTGKPAVPCRLLQPRFGFTLRYTLPWTLHTASAAVHSFATPLATGACVSLLQHWHQCCSCCTICMTDGATTDCHLYEGCMVGFWPYHVVYCLKKARVAAQQQTTTARLSVAEPHW